MSSKIALVFLISCCVQLGLCLTYGIRKNRIFVDLSNSEVIAVDIASRGPSNKILGIKKIPADLHIMLLGC